MSDDGYRKGDLGDWLNGTGRAPRVGERTWGDRIVGAFLHLVTYVAVVAFLVWAAGELDRITP